ncbi:MAG: DUF1343 domain-containing protein [Planctomycetota bacterium]
MLEDPPDIVAAAPRIGLLCNQASIDAGFHHAADAIHRRFPKRLACLFGPQHGLWSTEQDNMVETPHGAHPRLGIPVHSLYAERRVPDRRMLEGVDLLIVDLPDIGTRVYTYVWTLMGCMQACAEARIPVLVLDRPNPIGGRLVEGPLLDRRFASFVGLAPIPMRHGLTLGELARLLNEQEGLGCELEVLAVEGWGRDMLWPEFGRPFIPPSPNMPRFETALVYPGQVLLEGTNLSEGRGTTTPFEQWGAPWLDPWRLLDWLEDHAISGCALRPVRFEPTFHKFRGETCGGLFVHPTDPAVFAPYRATLLWLRAVAELWPDDFCWRPPPYEYEAKRMPIDILTGGDAVRDWIDGRGDPELAQRLAAPPGDWWARVGRFLLYE